MTWTAEQRVPGLDRRRDAPPQAGPPVVYPWQYYAATPAQWAAAMNPAPAPAGPEPAGGVKKLAYTVSEAAEALGVSRKLVYDLIHSGDFPSLKVGGRRLISAELLSEWVRRQAGG